MNPNSLQRRAPVDRAVVIRCSSRLRSWLACNESRLAQSVAGIRDCRCNSLREGSAQSALGL
ncbi:hypothetical protein GLA29479_2059 [Lysobacter antibioticus]|nr:hypothetical protein GLA29479_2059 [Lysobacter antibioticus]